jgi:hypothetical protein
VICADQIYRTRSNQAFCQRHGIRLSGPRLGRPKNDPELVAAEKQQFIDDQRQRNAVEGKIGQGKRRYGLGLILEKLAATQGSSIAMNILVMNLQKLLELLFAFVVFVWRLLATFSRSPECQQWVSALSTEGRLMITLPLASCSSFAASAFGLPFSGCPA